MIDAHRRFREFLKTHQDEAKRDAALKLQLAQEYRNDIEAYIAGKVPFIQSILAGPHVRRAKVDESWSPKEIKARSRIATVQSRNSPMRRKSSPSAATVAKTAKNNAKRGKKSAAEIANHYIAPPQFAECEGNESYCHQQSPQLELTLLFVHFYAIRA